MVIYIIYNMFISCWCRFEGIKTPRVREPRPPSSQRPWASESGSEPSHNSRSIPFALAVQAEVGHQRRLDTVKQSLNAEGVQGGKSNRL